jgi:hypothetical protein
MSLHTGLSFLSSLLHDLQCLFESLVTSRSLYLGNIIVFLGHIHVREWPRVKWE